MISFIINSCSQFIENNFKVFYKEQRIHTNYFRVWNFGKLFTSLPAIRAEHHKRKADKLVTFLKHHSYRKLIGAFLKAAIEHLKWKIDHKSNLTHAQASLIILSCFLLVFTFPPSFQSWPNKNLPWNWYHATPTVLMGGEISLYHFL